MASILARSLRGAVVRGTEAAAGQAASVQQLQLHTSSACSGSLQIPDRLKDIPTAAVSIIYCLHNIFDIFIYLKKNFAICFK